MQNSEARLKKNGLTYVGINGHVKSEETPKGNGLCHPSTEGCKRFLKNEEVKMSSDIEFH